MHSSSPESCVPPYDLKAIFPESTVLAQPKPWLRARQRVVTAAAGSVRRAARPVPPLPRAGPQPG